MRIHLLVFTAILIAGIGVTPAFAQIGEPIIVSTNKLSYSVGEKIMVSGEVSDILSGYAISLQVFAPNGNLVAVAQPQVGADRTYSSELTAGGQMRASGVYTIKVLYGTEDRTAETTFEFDGMMNGVVGADTEPTIDVVGFPVGYNITGGSILGIVPNVDANSLIIEVSATRNGELTIILPRELADAKLNGCEGVDDDFFVVVDGEEVDFDETRTSSDRILTIAFPDGAEEIEIIGTCVIPEFGVITILILAVAIISIIVVSAKARLSITPKF